MRPSRITDPEFRNAVAELAVPGMGTESVAPLLADLIGFLRPRRVLEVGMGYTTPFLAAALAGTEEQARAESEALAVKTRRHLDAGGELDDSWLLEHPPLVTPASHLTPHRPKMVAVDDLSMEDSSARQVLEVLRKLRLADFVSVIDTDLRTSRDLLPEDSTPIDFAWVDAWECLYFFDHFWELINPDGGMVVMHYLTTYPEGEALIRYIKAFQRSNPGELETVNLLEPHKLMQNSITVLRRTSGVHSLRYAETGGKIKYSGQLQADAAAHSQRHAD
ncbi:O-methyltransferase [Allosalinactinospora lopnorensis]|uniref:class I SAM-dependent methyltransferase n=1 Tax=Allosalinactinospora lopnorensis TaxID=1352348 RepID=UPI0006971FC8|nr:class I SAM-dependent methyltransferase [Allosalinactinospora lopnorensis]